MRLTQIRWAAALAAGMVAVPAVPVLAVTVGPADDWHTAAGGQPVTAVSGNGAEVGLLAPPGWQYRTLGDTVVIRSGSGSSVQLRVFDREGRDPDAMAQRVIRSDRIAGATAALTGQPAAAGDGDLRGRRCAIVVEGRSGPCAFLSDADVLVAVDAVGTADDPAPPLDEILTWLHRSDQ